MKKIKKKNTQIYADHSIIDLLLLDHRNFKDACTQLISAEADKKIRYQTAKKFIENFTLHMIAEEKVVYSYLKRMNEFKMICLEAEIEHEIFKNRVKKIKSIQNQTRQLREDLEVQLKVFSYLIKNHLMTEESELFSLMQERLDKTELYDLGRKFIEKRKMELSDFGNYPILEDEIISWKDSLQKMSSEILTRMNKHVEDLRH